MKILLLLSILFSSCASYYCKGSKDYTLKQGTVTDSLYVQAKLIARQETMTGIKHWFVTEKNDTIISYLNCRCFVGEMYWVLKSNVL